MDTTNRKYRFAQFTAWIQEGVFLLACFFYLLFVIHPVLATDAQPVTFFLDNDFLSRLLSIPGGGIDWLAALSMQLWTSNFSSAVILLVCFFLVARLTKIWMGSTSDIRPLHTVHLIPVCLFLLLYSQYDFRLSVVLAVIVNLCFLVLLFRWGPEHPDLRIGGGGLAAALLFWITGGAYLLFVVLFAMTEVLFRKQFIRGAVFLFVVTLIPFAASETIFLVPLKQAYVHNLCIEDPMQLPIVAYGMLIFFPVWVLLALLAKLPGVQKLLQKKSKQKKTVKYQFASGVIAGTLLLSGGTYLIAQGTDNDGTGIVFQTERLVRAGQWSGVLELTRNYPYTNPLLASQMNLALYETHDLLENMFVYPQLSGTSGLVLNKPWCLEFPEEASDLFLKMGLVNEAQHWAHEALELKGATPTILKQLGTIYLLKGIHETAGQLFLALRKVPSYEKAADEMLGYNEDSSKFVLQSKYTELISSMPSEDCITYDAPASQELKLLLKKNPKNKMAFEYLLAYYLLNANIGGIWNHMSSFSDLKYARIPRHVQEALLVYANSTTEFDPNKLRNWIETRTLARFNEYQDILNQYQGDNNRARQSLYTRFGDTFWYYLMFTRTASMPLEGRSEFQ
jgi:hypothetical protein